MDEIKSPGIGAFYSLAWPVKCRCHPIPPGLILFHGKYDFKLGRAADIGPLGELLNRSYPCELLPSLLSVRSCFDFIPTVTQLGGLHQFQPIRPKINLSETTYFHINLFIIYNS